MTTLVKSGLLHHQETPGRARFAIPDARALLNRARRWSTPLRNSSPSTPSLTLDLIDRTLRVRGPKVFEFVLASRTQFPAKRLMSAMQWHPKRLEQAAATIRRTEHRLSELLTRSSLNGDVLDEAMRGLSLKTFSKDHQWRDIMECLSRLPPEYEPYKRTALVKYLQYLRSRRDALKGIFAERTAGMPNAHIELGSAQNGGDPHSRGTGDIALARLPKGETRRLNFNGESELTLCLAGNRYRLQAGHRFTLIDEAGRRLPLKSGPNIIGRHPQCDVTLDPNCRVISRRHVILEPIGEDAVLATDVSAHGTQAAASQMA